MSGIKLLICQKLPTKYVKLAILYLKTPDTRQLVKLAKQEIAEIGWAEFKQNIICSQGADIASIKKEPEGSDFNSSTCIKWWRLGDSNS